MKKQYGILQVLRVVMHPNKTFIGKVKKGFDFLGFHLTPTEVTVSDTALSRHEDKVARLYEQDAKPKRIRAYRLRWLVWGCVVATSSAAAVGPNGGTFAIPELGSSNFVSFKTSTSTDVLDYPFGAFMSSATACDVLNGANCGGTCTAGTPTALASTLSTTPAAGASPISSLTFAAPGVDLPDTTSPYCLVQDGSAALWAILRIPTAPFTTATVASRVFPCNPTDTFDPALGCAPAAAAQNIPIFGPIGLLAMLSGLLWFGTRRQLKDS